MRMVRKLHSKGKMVTRRRKMYQFLLPLQLAPLVSRRIKKDGHFSHNAPCKDNIMWGSQASKSQGHHLAELPVFSPKKLV